MVDGSMRMTNPMGDEQINARQLATFNWNDWRPLPVIITADHVGLHQVQGGGPDFL